MECDPVQSEPPEGEVVLSGQVNVDMLNATENRILTQNTDASESYVQNKPKKVDVERSHNSMVKRSIEITQKQREEIFKLNELDTENEAELQEIKKIQEEFNKIKGENIDMEKKLHYDMQIIKDFSAQTKKVDECVSIIEENVEKCKHNVKIEEFRKQCEKFRSIYEDLKKSSDQYHTNKKYLEEQKSMLKNKLKDLDTQKTMEIFQKKDKILFLKSVIIEKQVEMEKIQNLGNEELDHLKKVKDESLTKLNELLNFGVKENYDGLVKEFFQIKYENKAHKEIYQNEIYLFLNQISNTELEINSLAENINMQNKNIEISENKISDLTKESDDLKENLRVNKTILENKKIAFDNNKLDLEEKLEETEAQLKEKKNEFLKIKNQRKDRKNELEILKTEYFARLQEMYKIKSDVLEKKESEVEPRKKITFLEISAKKLSKELKDLDSKCRELERFIHNKSEEIELEEKNLTKELEKLTKKLADHESSHASKMEELDTDHKYYQASSTYLELKQKSLKEKLNQITEQKNQVHNELLKSQGVIETKKERVRIYNAHLDRFNGISRKPDENSNIAGILKSPGVLAGPSPKKVKFLGLTSSDGSSQDLKAIQNFDSLWKD